MAFYGLAWPDTISRSDGMAYYGNTTTVLIRPLELALVSKEKSKL